MARYDDLNTGAIAYSVVAGSVLLLLIIIAVKALCNGMIETEEENKLAKSHYETSDAEITRQRQLMAAYDKIVTEQTDENGKPIKVERYVIPIDQAREIVLHEMATPGT
ncbi:MAG: hypothetical protein KDB03_14420 [Planctomycetales bacterium]|nr:hypothetical protein [Planctomycetales bacterium]